MKADQSEFERSVSKVHAGRKGLALAARGQPGVAQLLDLFAAEMRVAMTADDRVSAVARQRRAVHVPWPER